MAAYHLGASESLVLCSAGMGFMACFDGKTWIVTHEDKAIS